MDFDKDRGRFISAFLQHKEITGEKLKLVPLYAVNEILSKDSLLMATSIEISWKWGLKGEVEITRYIRIN